MTPGGALAPPGPTAVSPTGDTWQELGRRLDTFDDDTPPTWNGWVVLLEAIEERRPAWQADALCAEYPELPWFPERGQDPSACREVCGRCLVAAECAAYAAEIGARSGIWAGASTRKRRQNAA